MLNYKLLNRFFPNIINGKNLVCLWLFTNDAVFKEITVQEKQWANQLPKRRSEEYQYSRGYARFALASLFGIKPLDIPLNSYPGKVPELKEGWGYLSISHCKNAVLIGWSPQKIGIDIENSNRIFNEEKIYSRYFSIKEKKRIALFNNESYRNEILSNWVLKEASIKWQRGKLFKDLSEWEISNNKEIAIHKKLKEEIKLSLIDFDLWIIGIAYNRNLQSHFPIICME